MSKHPLRYYIGYDPRDTLAFEVCVASMRKRASIPVEVVPLKDWDVRRTGHYWRDTWTDGHGQLWDVKDWLPCSTSFSYLRFCIPLLEGFGDDWVLWSDPDVLWRADIAELVDLIDPDKAVMCVKHDHEPPEPRKMTGTLQRHYARKNWTSVMCLKPAACRGLTRYAVNNMTKDWLHQFCWQDDSLIGGLPEAWNWLCGWSNPKTEPKLVHFTRGTPDMPGHENEPYAKEWLNELAESGADLAAFPMPAR